MMYIVSHSLFPGIFHRSLTGSRIRNVMRWKRPRVWITLFSSIVCIALTVSCAVNPSFPKPSQFPSIASYCSSLEVPDQLKLHV